MSKTPAALKYPGGKYYLAQRIVAFMPPHTHYVEPYFGGGSVLFARDPKNTSEVVNDLDARLTNFWRVLQDTRTFERFKDRINVTPFSEQEWLDADPDASADPVSRAIAFFIRARQSLAGRQDSFATLSKNRTRRGMNEQASAWLSAIQGLPQVHERLQRVVILNHDALQVIRQEDSPNTLYYLDPPYLKSSRAAPEVYAHEMTDDQHNDLLNVLASIKGKFLLSGYHSPLYDDFARANNWDTREFIVPNSAAGGAKKRRMTEVLWANFRMTP